MNLQMMYEEDILAQLVLLLDQRKDLVELFYILKVIDTITQNTSMYSICEFLSLFQTLYFY